MRSKVRKKIHLVALLYIATLSPLSPEPLTEKKANKCVKISSHQKRLSCFDEIFKTPLTIKKSESSLRKLHPLLKASKQLESQRKVMGQWLYKQEKDRIIITQLSSTNKAILTIECKNNITSLALILPKVINSGSVPITLKTNHNNWEIEKIWRVLDDKQLVIAPRGIPTVRLIRQLLQGDQLNISVKPLNDHKGNTEQVIDFSLQHLKTAILPLQTACQW